MSRYIGLMSGTSMDGVDAVLAELDDSRWLGARAHAFVPYPDELKSALLALQDTGSDELHRSALLAQTLAALNAQAVAELLQQAGEDAAHIRAVGCHGQTIRHAPQHGYSLQLMDWARLAELSGITVIGDFRSRDLAAGGQGAPLAPAFHQAVFASPQHSRVVLNLGGIANISVLPEIILFGRTLKMEMRYLSCFKLAMLIFHQTGTHPNMNSTDKCRHGTIELCMLMAKSAFGMMNVTFVVWWLA